MQHFDEANDEKIRSEIKTLKDVQLTLLAEKTNLQSQLEMCNISNAELKDKFTGLLDTFQEYIVKQEETKHREDDLLLEGQEKSQALLKMENAVKNLNQVAEGLRNELRLKEEAFMSVVRERDDLIQRKLTSEEQLRLTQQQLATCNTVVKQMENELEVIK